MSQADDLMREAHGLAEKIRRQRADHAVRKDGASDGLRTLEARLAGLWRDIRAARAGSLGTGAEPTLDRRTRPKWE